jgi:peptidoglycan/xylan/chitin deacetylase (PgdA/CDA1 family)
MGRERPDAREGRRIAMRVAVLDRNMGVNRYALGLAEGLRESGHEVLIGTAAGAGIPAAHAVYPQAGVGGRHARKLVEVATGVAEAIRCLCAFRPDVVHYQWTSPLDLLLQTAVSRAVPAAASVVTVHRAGGRVQKTMLARSQAAVAFAPAVAREMDGPVELIRHGNYAHTAQPVAHDEARRELGLPADGFVLAFVGQIRPGKCVEAFLRAAPSAATLLVAGTVVDRAYRERLAEIESNRGLRVRWIESEDALPARTMVAATCAANAVVLPLADPVQSASVIFSMTLGACVVTTDVGETAATVGENGIVVPAGDEDALAAALAGLDPVRADELGRSARRAMLEERSWSGIARDVERIYADAIASRRRSPAALVLGFHAVEDSSSELAVSRDALRRHVERLLARGFRFVTVSELAAASGRVAAVTFDDGYRSVHEAALPVLSELGITATVFAIAEKVGETDELPGAGSRPLMSWDELRDLNRHGWEIGSHTLTHPDLTGLADDELERELAGSRELIESEIGHSCTSLAYPYGAVDARVAAAARRAGFETAFTVPRRWRAPQPLLWPRVTVWRSDAPATVALKASAPVRAVRGSRLGSAMLAAAGAHQRGGKR